MYSMVTRSPTLGIAPLPSLRMVLVTPMAAEVREKLRIVLVLVLVVVESDGLASLRSFDAEEEDNMAEENRYGREGGDRSLCSFLSGADDVVRSAGACVPSLSFPLLSFSLPT